MSLLLRQLLLQSANTLLNKKKQYLVCLANLSFMTNYNYNNY